MANRRSVTRTLVAGAASIGAPRLFAQDDKSTVTCWSVRRRRWT